MGIIQWLNYLIKTNILFLKNGITPFPFIDLNHLSHIFVTYKKIFEHIILSKKVIYIVIPMYITFFVYIVHIFSSFSLGY